MKKTSRRFIGLLLVIALLVSLPVVSMAGDATDDLAVNNEIEDNLVIDGNDEIDDAPVVDEPAIDKTDDKPASLVVTNSVASMGNVVAQDATSEQVFEKSIFVMLGTSKADVITQLNNTKVWNNVRYVYLESWVNDDYDAGVSGSYNFTNKMAKSTTDTTTYKVKVTVTVVDDLTDKTLGELFKDDEFAKYVYVEILGNTSGDANSHDLDIDDATKFIKSGNSARTSLTNLNKYNLESLDGIEHFRALENLSYQPQSGNANITEIPRGVTELTNLHTITINYCKITEVPDFISQVKSLKTLNLRRNKIGNNFENCYNITNLESLTLIENGITEIPAGISKLKKLNYLSFAFNKIKDVPDEVWNLKTLTGLALANNIISDISGVKNLTNLDLLTLSNNRISDFSPLYENESTYIGGKLNFSQFRGSQMDGQVKYADNAIEVPVGSTTAAVDINDYQFNYFSSTYMGGKEENGGDEVTVYDKADINVIFNYGYYPQISTPDKITHEKDNGNATEKVGRKNAAKKDRTFNLPIKDFVKEDGTTISAVLLTMQAPGAQKENSYSENWTSFYNCDITYIIPVSIAKPAVAGDDAVPPSSVLGEEAPAEDEAKVLGEEAKTFDSMDWALIAGIALVMLIGLAVLFRRREME